MLLFLIIAILVVVILIALGVRRDVTTGIIILLIALALLKVAGVW
jgi:hypothetical protein